MYRRSEKLCGNVESLHSWHGFCHTRTSADLWSIEAAVESGRRAARLIDPKVPLIEQRMPWVRAARRADDALYAMGGPNVVDVTVGLICFLAVVVIGAVMR